MPDLSINFCGIKSPNPFWLASAPPTNTGEQIMRAFDLGWGGAVWKTVSTPATNVHSRLSATNYQGKKLIGLTNIEWSSDRPIEINLKEACQIKKEYPKNAIIISIVAEEKAKWHDLVKRCADAGVDGIELNFSCPHGLCERGMGAAIGQDVKAIREIISWVREIAEIPVLVKLTPNVADIVYPGRAAVKAGADGLVLINTIKSISNVDLDSYIATPRVGKKFASGGYSGPAVKPIALYMLAQLASDTEINIPISGVGGITDWRDAAEFIALGATSVQICTAVMHHGYGIITEMIKGLEVYLTGKRMHSVNELRGKALTNYSSWHGLDQNYKVKASIDKTKCIGCQSCYIACLDGGHQCIHTTKELCQAYHGENDHAQNVRVKQPPQHHEMEENSNIHVPFINEQECVGCNLCSLVCPVGCIAMKEID